MALKYAGIEVEHREIELRNKPQAMLLASPKGTVPVLCISKNLVLDQSLAIMHWALEQCDPEGWTAANQAVAQSWIDKNDGPFKVLLDQYKYPNRHPELHTEETLKSAVALMFEPMEAMLQAHQYLMGDRLSWVDIAIFPFIRQFSMVKPAEFQSLPFPAIKQWLQKRIDSELFQSVMNKYPVWIESPHL